MVKNDLKKRYLALGFREDEDREEDWLALVQHFLLANNALPKPRTRDGPVSDFMPLVPAFMRTYGPRLWPSEPEERRHLTSPVRRPQRSFVFAVDGHLSEEEKVLWRLGHEGRDPTAEEQMVSTVLGRKLVYYIRSATLTKAKNGVKKGDAGVFLERIVSVTEGEEEDSASDPVEHESEGEEEDDDQKEEAVGLDDSGLEADDREPGGDEEIVESIEERMRQASIEERERQASIEEQRRQASIEERERQADEEMMPLGIDRLFRDTV